MNKFFCEVVQNTDSVIKFRMVEADLLEDAVRFIRKQYTDIKELIIKDMSTQIRSSFK